MTSKARRALTALAAVAVIFIAGGVLFDRRETQTYSECTDGPRTTFGAGDLSAPSRDPDAYTGTLYLFACGANRGGLALAGIGAVLLGISVIVWWALRWTGSSARG